MNKAVLLCLALIPSVAVAAGNAGDKQDKKHGGLICREIDTTGSRLESQRICMTREQWEQQRRDARETIDRAQTQQNNPKGG
ncbi:MAG TPA: hypothetical protein VGF77_11680 [Allosphingosinicella sp.]